jgi:hypothetical protein
MVLLTASEEMVLPMPLPGDGTQVLLDVTGRPSPGICRVHL